MFPTFFLCVWGRRSPTQTQAASLPHTHTTAPAELLRTIYQHLTNRYSSLHCTALAPPGQTPPSLYSCLLTGSYRYVASLSADAFPALEQVMFEQLVSPDFYPGLFTVDIWTLLAPHLPMHVCLQHAVTAAELWAGVGAEWLHRSRLTMVRCAFFDRYLHSRMSLVPTPARLKRTCVCPIDFLSGVHCSYRYHHQLRQNIKGTTGCAGSIGCSSTWHLLRTVCPNPN
jgi:hypothetical protein